MELRRRDVLCMFVGRCWFVVILAYGLNYNIRELLVLWIFIIIGLDFFVLVCVVVTRGNIIHKIILLNFFSYKYCRFFLYMDVAYRVIGREEITVSMLFDVLKILVRGKGEFTE